MLSKGEFFKFINFYLYYVYNIQKRFIFQDIYIIIKRKKIQEGESMEICPFWSTKNEMVKCYEECTMNSKITKEECVFKELLIEDEFLIEDEYKKVV